MSLHTPGPWRVVPKYEGDAESIGILGRMWGKNAEDEVALIRYAAGSDEDAANARLIAAAPSMYEYVRRCAADGDAQAQRILESIDHAAS